MLDACVLYPAPLRDLLLSLASAGLYRAKWSQRIHDEWTRNLLQKRPDLKLERLQATCLKMNLAVPDSLVTGYEDLIESLQLLDPDDRHVLAAAIRSDADAIITFNQRDFGELELAKYDIFIEHPDEFVSIMVTLYTPRVISVVREMRGRLRNPPKSVDEFLNTLHQQGLPLTVIRLSEFANAL